MTTHSDSKSTAFGETETRDINSVYRVFSNHLDRARGIIGLMRRGLNEDDGENAAAAAYEHIESAEKLAEQMYRLGTRDAGSDRRETQAETAPVPDARPVLVGGGRQPKGGKANGIDHSESGAAS